MFLNQLSNKEKKAFIELSIIIAKSNGILEEAEKEMLYAYCKEMDIPPADIDKENNIESVIEVFKKSTDHVKRIVILESLGLAYSDGKLDPEEDNLMNSFANKIGIDSKTYQDILILLNKYTAVLNELVEKI